MKEGFKEFEAQQKNISEIFESNYFVVNIRSLSSSLEFLKIYKNTKQL